MIVKLPKDIEHFIGRTTGEAANMSYTRRRIHSFHDFFGHERPPISNGLCSRGVQETPIDQWTNSPRTSGSILIDSLNGKIVAGVSSRFGIKALGGFRE